MTEVRNVLCIVGDKEVERRLSASLAAVVPPCLPEFSGLPAALARLEAAAWDALVCAAWLLEPPLPAALDRFHGASPGLPVVLLVRPDDDAAPSGARAVVATDELTPRVLGRVLAAARAERARVEELRELQHQYRTAFRLSRIPNGIATLEGRIQAVNPALCELLGESEAELVGSHLGGRLRPEDAAWVGQFAAAAAAGGPPTASAEVVAARRGGPPLFADLNLSVLPSMRDRPPLLVISLTDLARGERHFRALVENSADATALLAVDGTILDAGPSTPRVTGFQPAEIEGRSTFLSVHRDDLPGWETFFGRLLTRPRDVVEAAFRFYHRERGWCWMEGTGRNLLAEPAVAAIVINYRDVGERRRADEALRSSEQRYRALFEQNPQPMLVYEPGSFRLLASNDAARRLYGYEADEFTDMSLPELFQESDRERLSNAHPTYYRGFHNWGVWGHRKRDGTAIDVEINSCAYELGGRATHLALVREVTEIRRMEEQSRQAQKMEAIGQLAGGVAHDFNNMLTVISGYSDLILSQLEPGSQLRQRMGEIQKAAARAASLTRQLLAFSRQQVLQPKVLNLNDAVSGMADMLRRLIGEDIELNLSLDTDLAYVAADPGQLEQVIMNLAVNARDAMRGGGQLHFSTKHAELDGAYSELHPNVVPGRYVLLSASDTGSGMDAATQARIFEPFFSTKGNKGTGLGLSTVYGIVKQSNGYIWVYSEIGLGTTFKIYLPRVNGAPETAAAEPPAPRASGAILLVENDSDLRKLTAEILAKAGYEVLAAASGVEAIELYRKNVGQVVLLLTDVVLPGLGGAQLANQFEAGQPASLPVIFMSGYGSEDALRRGLVPPRRSFLQKPFTTQTLLAAVRDAIASRS